MQVKMGFVLVMIFPVLILAVPPDTLKVDAVELTGGKEVVGKPEFSSKHYRFVYLFANEKNQMLFEQEPGRYQIQLGGACARMGALSGVGTTDIHAVHENKIYIFASEACRKTFLSNPEGLLQAVDPAPAMSPESVKEGAALLTKAIAALGGVENLDAVASYYEEDLKEIAYRDKNVTVRKTRAIAFPDKLRADRYRDTWHGVKVLAATDGFFVEADGVRPMESSQKAAFQREFAHDPLYILRARNRDDFNAVGSGGGTLGSTDVSYLTVHFDGTATTLTLDADSGRILGSSYTGRGPELFLGKVEKFFTDFRLVDGLILPMTVSGKFDGEIVPAWSKTLNSVVLNKEFPPDYFTSASE